MSYESTSSEKAKKYVKRLLKSKIYHSDTIRYKLYENYDYKTTNEVMRYLERNNYLKDDEFLKRLINLFVIKGYGELRFRAYLNSKHINCKNYILYTYENEKKAIDKAYEINKHKFKKYDTNEQKFKIFQKFSYLGFSKRAINYIIDKERT